MADRFLLVLWLTSRCNLSCSYCYAGACSQGRDMTFETAKKVIDVFGKSPLKIQFAGGEPTLNFPLAEEILNYIREKQMDVLFQLQTNGTLLTENMVRILKGHHVSVGVSLDGIPESNALTRGHTAETVRGIRLLGQQGMMVGLNAVVTGETVDFLPKFPDFALYLQNVGGIGLDLLRHAGRGQKCTDAKKEQLQTAFTAMYQRTQTLQKQFGIEIQLRETELAKKRLRGLGNREHYCYASCGRSAVVLPDGKIYPCGSLLSPDYFMGTAETIQPDHLLSLPKKSAPQCADCKYESVCPGGCPSRQIRNSSDLECTLLKTAFSLAERDLYEHRNQHNGYGPGSGSVLFP